MAGADSSEREAPLRNFYELERAAETAARWPLLLQVWNALGGSNLVASGSPLTTRISGAEAPPQPAPRVTAEPVDPLHNGHNGHHPLPPAEPAPAPRHADPVPVASLEELFGKTQ